jgi:hypothetical protein
MTLVPGLLDLMLWVALRKVLALSKLRHLSE